MTRTVMIPTRVTRTHPPGGAHLRVKAPPGPPRPVNMSKWKQQFFQNGKQKEPGKYMEGKLKLSD